jgi:hypothetical protein
VSSRRMQAAPHKSGSEIRAARRSNSTRFLRPAHLKTYEASELGARRSFGHVLNDQGGRLVSVVVANADDLKRPARVDWDCVAGLPAENGDLRFRGAAGSAWSRHDHRAVLG